MKIFLIKREFEYIELSTKKKKKFTISFYKFFNFELLHDSSLYLFITIVGSYEQGCATNPPKPTRPNPTRRVGSVFRAWWDGLGYKIFFDSGSGWVRVIKFQIRPDSPIYLTYIYIYIYNILYNSYFFFKITNSPYSI